jgi:hypothetical protein
LTGLFNIRSYIGDSSVVRFALFGGVKCPTGDSDRLGEELDEEHHSAGGDADGPDEHAHDEEGQVQLVARHVHAEADGEQVESAIHGHDLALGSDLTTGPSAGVSLRAGGEPS